MILIGICFFDAARFRENCFSAKFIYDEFMLAWSVDNHFFRSLFAVAIAPLGHEGVLILTTEEARVFLSSSPTS